jgi:hypothetical protein
MERIRQLLRRLRRPVDPERARARAQAQARSRAAREAYDRDMPHGLPGGGF